jgi:hypothetical protein
VAGSASIHHGPPSQSVSWTNTEGFNIWRDHARLFVWRVGEFANLFLEWGRREVEVTGGEDVLKVDGVLQAEIRGFLILQKINQLSAPQSALLGSWLLKNFLLIWSRFSHSEIALSLVGGEHHHGALEVVVYVELCRDGRLVESARTLHTRAALISLPTAPAGILGA